TVSGEHSRHQRRRGERWRVSGERIGPFGAVIDPTPDDLDLLGPERPGRRHLWTELRAADFDVQKARAAVAGMDDARTGRSTAHRVAAPIEPQAGLVE